MFKLNILSLLFAMVAMAEHNFKIISQNSTSALLSCQYDVDRVRDVFMNILVDGRKCLYYSGKPRLQDKKESNCKALQHESSTAKEVKLRVDLPQKCTDYLHLRCSVTSTSEVNNTTTTANKQLALSAASDPPIVTINNGLPVHPMRTVPATCVVKNTCHKTGIDIITSNGSYRGELNRSLSKQGDRYMAQWQTTIIFHEVGIYAIGCKEQGSAFWTSATVNVIQESRQSEQSGDTKDSGAVHLQVGYIFIGILMGMHYGI